MTRLHGCHNRPPMVDTQRVQKDTNPGCAGCRWQIGANLGAAPSA